MKTLYIIGNGFDLAHDMPTSYWHFQKWLKDSKDENARRLHWALSHLEEYCHVSDLWGSLEEGLGEVDIEEYLKDIKDEHVGPGGNYIDNYGRVCDAVSAWYDIDKEYILENIGDFFAKWIRSINDDVETDEEFVQWLEPNGLYLSFNYTSTLEKVYNIDPQNILHIHGNAKNKQDYLEFGHGKIYDLDECEKIGDKVLGFDSDSIAKHYGEELNKLYKDTKSILERNQQWFDNISIYDIKTIYCYGLSFGKVDDLYYKDIIKQVPNAQWIFYIYQGKDYNEFDRNINAVLAFIKRMHLDKKMCKAYDSFFIDRKVQLN